MNFGFGLQKPRDENVIRRILLVMVMFLLVLLIQPASAQQKPLGIFSGQTDVGKVEAPGSVSYETAEQEYIVEGAGSNM